jgi:hypothetical protein
VPDGDGISRVAVNGAAVTPAEAHGYVEIVRRWQRGDTIAFTLPMPTQRVYGSDKITAGEGRPSPVKGRVALRVGPLLYNIEKLDQDITLALDRFAPLSREWRGDLLGGVAVIRGTFAGGAPMLAIPNFARFNRYPPPPPPAPAPAPGTPAAPRPAPPPPESIVWIRET